MTMLRSLYETYAPHWETLIPVALLVAVGIADVWHMIAGDDPGVR